MSKFTTFFKKSMEDALKKINKMMKDEGIVYLYDSEETFYNPYDIDIVSYATGEDYADGHYTEKLTLTDLEGILPKFSEEDEECDFSHFTSKAKLDRFITEGFAELKMKQRLEYIRGEKSSIREKINRLENEIHYKSQELDKAKNELDDFEAEEARKAKPAK